MKLDQFGQRHVAETVAVSEEKFLIRNVRQGAPDASAGLRGEAGVEQRDLPVLLGMLVVIGDLRRRAEAQRHVARVALVIEEIFLDDFGLVAEAEDEFLEAVVGVEFHDVPEDRAVADRHHGFGAKFLSSRKRKPSKPPNSTK